MSFRFIHCADLHLDTPFLGITAESTEIISAVRESTFEAFNSVVRLAIETGAEFLLLAGDIFDAGKQSVRAVLKFRDMLQELDRHGIRIFMVHGNHDPAQNAFSAVSWPDSTHVFPSSRPETVPFHTKDGSTVSVTGQSHETASIKQNLAAHFPERPDSEFRIALLHAHAGTSSMHAPYAPCNISQLKQQGFDYWALGHVHRAKILAARPHIVYPGCIQGRSFRETGPRGCYSVEVENSQVKEIIFQELDAVRWIEADLPVNDFSTIDSLEPAIEEKIDQMFGKSSARPLICRIRLTGRGPLYRELYRESTRNELVERIRENLSGAHPFVWLQEIRAACQPEFDIKERMKGDDFLAKALEAGEELLEQDRALEVFATLLSDRRISRLGITLDQEELMDIVLQAQMLCIDQLEGDSEA